MDLAQRQLQRQELDEDTRKKVLSEQAVELGQLRRVARHLVETYELASESAQREFAQVAHEASVVLRI